MNDNAMKKSKVELNQYAAAGRLFRPHGDVLSVKEGHFVLSHAHGPFNKEMIVSHRKQMISLLSDAGKTGRFVVLTKFYNSMLMSAETMNFYVESVAIIAREIPQLTGVAYVAADDVEGRNIMCELIEKNAFQPVGLPFKVFDNQESAKVWLEYIYSETV